MTKELARLSAPGQLLTSQWFKYEDQTGEHFCQTDVILVQPTRLVIFEAKLSHRPSAEFELRDLYGPVCRAVWDLPQVHVEVCKYWRGEVDGYDIVPTGKLLAAINNASGGLPFLVWHKV